MTTVSLTQGKKALIDDEDAESVLGFKWTYFFNPRNGKQYARRTVRDERRVNHTIYLHRFILNAPKGLQVDHKNGDGLDCQKSNLRLADNAQNHHNMKARNGGISGFKGVKRHGARWRAGLRCRGKDYKLGVFALATDAARAYDIKAREMFGEFARLNFPKKGEQGALQP